MFVTFKRFLFCSAGLISLTLGFMGIFLPLLPTTPFLLLAAFCFIRSSKRLYNWLMNHRIFGSYIYNYLNYKAVKKEIKIGSIALLWITLTFSFLAMSSIYIRLFLIAVGIGVTIHLLSLKNLQQVEDELKSLGTQ